jgi:hypothetical protein
VSFAGAFKKKPQRKQNIFFKNFNSSTKCLHKIFQFEILPVDFVGFILYFFNKDPVL